MEKQLNQLRQLIDFAEYPELGYAKRYGQDGNPSDFSIQISVGDTIRTTKRYEKKKDAYNEAVEIIQELKNSDIFYK